MFAQQNHFNQQKHNLQERFATMNPLLNLFLSEVAYLLAVFDQGLENMFGSGLLSASPEQLRQLKLCV